MIRVFCVLPIWLVLLFGFTVPVAAQDALFRNSFENLPTGIIDVASRFPVPGSLHGPLPGVQIGARFTVTRSLPPGTVALSLDGVDVTQEASITDWGVRYQATGPMTLGAHQIRLRVGDTVETWSFDVVVAPTVSDISPSGDLSEAANPPMVRAAFVDPVRNINLASVAVLLDGSPLPSPQVTMHDARSGEVTVAVPTALAVGNHAITIVVANDAGVRTEAAGAFRVQDPITYTAATVSPGTGAVVRDPAIVWRIHADSNRVNPELVRMSNGDTWTPVSYADRPREFRVPVDLVPGANTLDATVMYDDGTERTISTTVTYDAPPVVFVDSPEDFATLGAIAPPGTPTAPGGASDLTGIVARPVAITGHLSRPVVTVQINQQQAQLAPDGLTFQFPVYFLHEGTNLLSVVATDEFDRSGVAQRTLFVDQTAPLLAIESPLDAAVTSNAHIDLRGVANDAVEAQVGAAEPTVRVRNTANGQLVNALVGNRYFRAQNVPLELGINRLEVSAQDALGNARIRTLVVTRIAVGTSRLAAVSGDGQRGPIDAQLPEPLVVSAVSAEGSPLAGVPVLFDVIRGSGSLAMESTPAPVGNGQLSPRHQRVVTDAEGLARAWFTVGNEAGVFAHAVRAHLDGVPEDIVFMAQAERGPAAWVLVHGASGSQYVQAGAEPVDALSVIVIDDERNPIVDQPARFLIEIGDARFPYAPPGGVLGDQGRSLTVHTDKNGIASVRPTVGSEAGTVHIRAQLETGTGLFGAADFQLMVLPVTSEPTRFSGVVLDHAGVPLAGVRVSISRTALSTTTDAEGKFRFEAEVPVGKIDLHIDGTNLTITRGNQTLQYPGLHFEVAVVAGQENQLPHPIYLPPINLSAAALVGGDADVTLTVPGIEGFAMVVKAHSVTFPDGSRTGPLVVTPVHGDRLPMVPPGGFASFGAIAWTIQPTGTRFDPPIEVRLPNSAGLKPGETLPIVQWDHDLATFVPMGRGTVDETGATVVSDPGSGITKAGWGGGPPPTPPNCGNNPPPSTCRGGTCGGCPQCQVSQAQAGQQCPSCRPDLAKVGKQCGSNWCTRCKGNGQCGADPKFPTAQPAGVTEVTFAEPRVEIGFTTNKAEFHGHRTGSNPADWDFELDAYCTPVGYWRFKLKKAEIKSVIVKPSLPGWREYNYGELLSNGPGPGQSQCQYYNSAEFMLRSAASTHYSANGGYNPVNNPDIANLVSQGWGQVWVPGWDTWTEIHAHELLHFRNFKRYAAQSFAALERRVGQIGPTVNDYPSKELVLASDFVRDQLRNVLNGFANDIIALQNANGVGDHNPPDAFYACSMGTLMSDIAGIDGMRATATCPVPTRTIGSCPN